MNVLLVSRACRCEVYTFRRLERHACWREGTGLIRGTSEISVLDTPFPCSLRHPNTLATAAWVNVGIFGCRPFVSTKGTALRRAIYAIHGYIQRPLHAAPMLAGTSASASLCLRGACRGHAQANSNFAPAAPPFIKVAQTFPGRAVGATLDC